MTSSTLYISLPGMDVHLPKSLLHRSPSKVQPLHNHVAYELICTQTETETVFKIIPPFLLHLGADTSDKNVVSMLFSFTQPPIEDICQVLQSIQNEPVTFTDDFHGYMRVQNALRLTQDLALPGVYEQIAAELRLLFICLARKQSTVCNNIQAKQQTLDNKRLAIMEDFFSLIGVSNPDCSKAQLATQLGVSERQLTRILEQTYHCNFSELVLRSRMRIAHANILAGEVSLERIAEHVGYRSVDAFKRAYREYFGESLQNYKLKP